MPALPARGAAVRELALPLPPARMPPVRAGRPLKRWRYVGVYGAELCLCAAEVWVGPIAQRFWGVATPDGRLLSGRSLLGSGGVAVDEAGIPGPGRAPGKGARGQIAGGLVGGGG